MHMQCMDDDQHACRRLYYRLRCTTCTFYRVRDRMASDMVTHAAHTTAPSGPAYLTSELIVEGSTDCSSERRGATAG
jgi:hypothetical protein